MIGTKPAVPFIGTALFNGAHQLISPSNTRVRYAGGTDVLDVISALDIAPDGVPTDIDGNSPPLNGRDQVWLVWRETFGVTAFALRQDVTFTPAADATPNDQADIDAAIVADRAKARIVYS